MSDPVEVARTALEEQELNFVEIGNRNDRVKWIEVAVRDRKYLLSFELEELPELSITYTGSELQFVHERYTVKSFPDLADELAAQLQDHDDAERDEGISARLTLQLCAVIARRHKKMSVSDRP